MQFRIDNPERIDTEVIARQHGAGDEVIVQFSKPCYSETLLRQINDLCERFTSKFQVRFYGHYGGAFDCANLRSLPAVRSLAVDCLEAAENHTTLTELQHLDELSLGVYLLDDQKILGAENFRNLKALTISETKKRNIDLSHFAEYGCLRSLFVGGHTKGIDAIAQLTALDELRLGQIGKTVSLSFVNKLANLGLLKLILGGRTNIDEIQHPKLKTLSLVRVQAFESFNPSALPGLRELHIEDQIRIQDLNFSAVNESLKRILVLNCKGLMRLSGLKGLLNLNEIRVSGTGLNIEEILASGLPPQLKMFAFYTGKTSLNKTIRARLDKLGYKEFERAA